MEEMKKKKTIDRLSTLPDDILVKILGLVPINTAATTTVLSRRLHGLWTQITSIRINKDYFTVTKNQEFPNVFEILEKLTSPIIKTCDIYFPKHTSDAVRDARTREQLRRLITTNEHVNAQHISLLFRHTLDRGGENIRLVLANGYSTFIRNYQFPMDVCDLKSLVELELENRCNYQWVLKDGENVSLPFMRKLSVPMNDSQVKVLPVIIRACPLLEYLTIKGHLSREHNNAIEISAQKLKSLVLQMMVGYTRKQLVIDAPLLQNLYIWDENHFSTYSFVNRPTALVTANVFRNYVSETPPLHKLEELEFIGPVCSASVLSLVSSVFQDMNQKVKLPIFVHLTSLNVGIRFQRQWPGLMHFFAFLPNLRRLDIELLAESKVQARNTIRFNHVVPSCLSEKVEIIHLSGLTLKAVPDELEMISYLLRVANVLKTLDIKLKRSVYDKSWEVQVCKEESDFCTQLYKFPKSPLLVK